MNVESLRKTLGSTALALALTACGDISEHDGPVPTGGTVVIAPSALSVTTAKGTMGDCNTPSPANAVERQVLISTFDQSGLPRGNVDIEVALDFAPSVFTALAEDFNGNGFVIGEPGEILAVGLLKTKTDDVGQRRIYIVLNVNEGCEYTGSLTVNSGTVVADMEFDVAD